LNVTLFVDLVCLFALPTTCAYAFSHFNLFKFLEQDEEEADDEDELMDEAAGGRGRQKFAKKAKYTPLLDNN